jgi:signal transduction histidine kinase
MSIGVGYGAYRLGLIDRSPRLSWTLLGGYALSTVLTFLNVWVTARLMFASQHDLLLATVLLLFAGSIAMSFGYLLSMSLTERIRVLNSAAMALRHGKLNVRVPPGGRDEVSELAQSFNEMAARLEEAARQQVEMEAQRRNLITWIGHDLRAPLTAMRVIVEAMADGVVTDPATVDRYLRTAKHHLHSLSQLLDDLFEIVEIDAGGIRLDVHRSSVNDLVSDALEGFSAVAARKDVRLKGGSQAGVGRVPVDVQKIDRVLTNLLDNALRHTPAGGEVQVSASGDGESVRIEVSDTGEGISQEELPHVFDRFYRGQKERAREGAKAGLGLAIAKGIVEAHGGEMGLESTLGKGTTAWFTLPR